MSHEYGMSFIIPCYNEEKNIERCIRSILKEVETVRNLQPFPFEIIVVDNNCTDRTAEIARNLGVKVVEESKKGIVHARQKGTEVAQYEFVANIDADNTLRKRWIHVALHNIQQPGVVACSGPVVYEGVSKLFQFGADTFYLFARLFHHIAGPTLQGGNYVIRKSAWEKMGGYDVNYEFYGEDTNTAVMIKKFGKVKLVPQLWIYSSPRRIKEQGLFKTMYYYITSYFAVALFGKKVFTEYKDFR